MDLIVSVEDIKLLVSSLKIVQPSDWMSKTNHPYSVR